MEVHFTRPRSAACPNRCQSRSDAEQPVKDAALRLLEQDAHFRAAVGEGVPQAARGDFIEEEEMDARLEQMLRS